MPARASYKDDDGFWHTDGPIKRHLTATLLGGEMKLKRSSGNPEHITSDLIYSNSIRHYGPGAFWATKTEEALMNVVDALRENYDAAEALWSQYEKKLASFRGMVKNDIAALDASAKSARDAVGRIKDAHDKLLATMNSAEMEKAIDNAERLASALERISGLKSHKLTLAVIDSIAAGKE